MARTIADGPPGLEVPHKINGPYGSIVMNVRTARPSRIRLTDIKGYYSLPDTDDNREAHIGRRGEAIYPGAPRGKTIVYLGELQSRTQEGLRNLTTAFKRSISTRSNEMAFQVQDPEVPWVYAARVIDCEIDEEQKNGPAAVWPWTRTFQLSLRLSDGRYYVDNGGAVYGGNVSGATVSVTNQGSTDTDPMVVCVAPGGVNITIENKTLGTQLQLNKPPAGAILFNFPAREITSGTDFSKYLIESESNWWDENVAGIIPGVNDITVVGGVWSISFYHAVE